MNAELPLPGLSGENPLGLLAALGALDGLERQAPDRVPALRWTDDVVPRAVLTGFDDIDEVIELLDTDRKRWRRSPVLTWGPGSGFLEDLKPSLDELRTWIGYVLERSGPNERADIDLLTALVSEGAAAESTGEAKPTHLHFTAGQQGFLTMVRTLAEEVGPDHFNEALVGPWRYGSDLPVLRWDSRPRRPYALQGANPSKEKRLGVPGADWLGFIGLTYFPVITVKGRLQTTACSPVWKRGTFTWPLWGVPLRSPTIRSLLRDTSLATASIEERTQRGVFRLLRSPVRRTDQGGYGSFGPPSELTPASASSGGARPNPLLR